MVTIPYPTPTRTNKNNNNSKKKRKKEKKSNKMKNNKKKHKKKGNKRKSNNKKNNNKRRINNKKNNNKRKSNKKKENKKKSNKKKINKKKENMMKKKKKSNDNKKKKNMMKKKKKSNNNNNKKKKMNNMQKNYKEDRGSQGERPTPWCPPPPQCQQTRFLDPAKSSKSLQACQGRSLHGGVHCPPARLSSWWRRTQHRRCCGQRHEIPTCATIDTCRLDSVDKGLADLPFHPVTLFVAVSIPGSEPLLIVDGVSSWGPSPVPAIPDILY
jgi:hypothetical protein